MMQVRPSTFSDILQLYKLAEEMHASSIYAGRCTLDKQAFRDLCFQTITNHGKNTCLFVAEQDGEVIGFVMGTLDRVYGIAKEFYATDLFFFVRKGAHGAAAPKLLDAFTQWGKSHPKVVEVFVGISGAIGDYERAAKMYERKGFRRDGVMLVMEVCHEQSS